MFYLRNKTSTQLSVTVLEGKAAAEGMAAWKVRKQQRAHTSLVIPGNGLFALPSEIDVKTQPNIQLLRSRGYLDLLDAAHNVVPINPIREAVEALVSEVTGTAPTVAPSDPPPPVMPPPVPAADVPPAVAQEEASPLAVSDVPPAMPTVKPSDPPPPVVEEPAVVDHVEDYPESILPVAGEPVVDVDLPPPPPLPVAPAPIPAGPVTETCNLCGVFQSANPRGMARHKASCKGSQAKS